MSDHVECFSDYELFVFDLDGTIISSKALMMRALAHCYRHTGHPGEPDYERFFSLMGAPLDVILSTLGLTPEAVAEYRRFSTAECETIEVFPEAVDALRLLAAGGRRLALFTGKDRDRTEAILVRHGLYRLFECVVTSDDVTHGKPDPEGLHTILRRTKVHAKNAVVIGDGHYDVLCAHRAHVDAAFAGWGTGDEKAVRELEPRWSYATAAKLRDAVVSCREAAVYALDIGGSKFEIARLWAGYVALGRREFPRTQDFADDMALLDSTLDDIATVEGKVAVVSFPGLVRDGIVSKWPNRPTWEGRDLRAILGPRLKTSHITIEDDANLGALSSRYVFPARSNALYVNVGTGIGCGILLDGTLVRGDAGHAGELGHTIVEPESALVCGCGRRGCLQLFASGRGMLDRLHERRSAYRRYASLAHLLAERSDDADVAEVLAEGGHALGIAIANLVCLLDVRLIHMGGSLSRIERFTAPFVSTARGLEGAFLGRVLDIRLDPFRNASLLGALSEASRLAELDEHGQAALARFVDSHRSQRAPRAQKDASP